MYFHPILFVFIFIVSIFVIIFGAITTYEEYTNKKLTLYSLFILFVILCVWALCDVNTKKNRIVEDWHYSPIQTIKHEHFVEQYVLDKNGKIIILKGYSEHTQALVETVYYTGSIPWIHYEPETEVTRIFNKAQ